MKRIRRNARGAEKTLRGREGGQGGGRKGQMDGCRLNWQHAVAFLKKKDKGYLKDGLEHYPWKELPYLKI